jgi:hypothetical protein
MVPPEQRGSWKDFFLFLVKVVALLAGLTAFGYVIFLMRRSLPF